MKCQNSTYYVCFIESRRTTGRIGGEPHLEGLIRNREGPV